MSKEPKNPAAPFPTAVPTPTPTPAARSVLNGRYAECSIGGAVLVFLFDWEIRVSFDYANLTAAGDRWKVRVPLDGDWTARGRGYIAPSATTSYIKAAFTSAVPIVLTFAGFTAAVGGAKIWEGSCYISGGRLSAPMALFEQEIELISTAAPSTGVS